MSALPPVAKMFRKITSQCGTTLFFALLFLSTHATPCASQNREGEKITWTRQLRGMLYKPATDTLSFTIDSNCRGVQGSLQIEATPTTSTESRFPPHQCTLTFPLGDKDCLLQSMGTWVGMMIESPTQPRIAVLPCRVSHEYKNYLNSWWKGTWNKEIPGLLFRGFQITPDPVKNSVRITFDQGTSVDSFVMSFLK
jgi:hypothetical protein